MGDLDQDPPVTTTLTRSTVAWWVVFCGPVVVAVSVAIAEAVAGGGVAAVWTFTIGVWALALTIGIAAAPSLHNVIWWLKALLVSFVAAGLALALVFGAGKVGVEVREDLKVTTTTTDP